MSRSLRRGLGAFGCCALLFALPACETRHVAAPAAARAVPAYHAFANPQRVTLRGYHDDAMEPFITRDGRYLLFNNKNDPRVDTRLHYAERIDDVTFDYRGEIRGANSPALDAVPSMDRHGVLYFVSMRSYEQTFSSLYQARFERGQVSEVRLVAGVSRRERGMINFDAEISADGNTLFIVDGRYTGGQVPATADIDMALRDGAGFRRMPAARDWLQQVNTSALEYAPAISSDLLELFFTRLDPAQRLPQPQILRASRARADAPFGAPERIPAIDGYVEAPTLSHDGRSLYYHKLEGRRFVIFRVTR